MKCQVATRTTSIEADQETLSLEEVKSMVAEAETRRETVIKIVRKTLRSEARMTRLLERVLKKRCTVDVHREVVATRVVAATRVAVAVVSETVVTVRKAAVVDTVTVAHLETVVVTDHINKDSVDPRYQLFLRAEKASYFQTILDSKHRIKAT